MIAGVKYVHTNLIAREWRKLAAFYVELFGCSVVPPERNYSGADLEAGTQVPGATLTGIHLRLPGHGDEGPTLEIFTYSELARSLRPQVNRLGYGHLIEPELFSLPRGVVHRNLASHQAMQRRFENGLLHRADAL